jgi:hypothetical protein
MSFIETVYTKLHKILDSFHYSVEFTNLSRFCLRKWKKEKVGGERQRREYNVRMDGVVCGLDTSG